jgi:hypothetical protein
MVDVDEATSDEVDTVLETRVADKDESNSDANETGVNEEVALLESIVDIVDDVKSVEETICDAETKSLVADASVEVEMVSDGVVAAGDGIEVGRMNEGVGTGEVDDNSATELELVTTIVLLELEAEASSRVLDAKLGIKDVVEEDGTDAKELDEEIGDEAAADEEDDAGDWV